MNNLNLRKKRKMVINHNSQIKKDSPHSKIKDQIWIINQMKSYHLIKNSFKTKWEFKNNKSKMKYQSKQEINQSEIQKGNKI